MRVLIAGGGTGGLATAIALRKAGIEPLVLEQAPAFTAIGADLLSSLLTALPPGCVRTGSRVVAFEETGRDVRVELTSGEEVRGDLLVGADGLRSATRRQLMGEREARFAGVVVWRGLIPREKVPQRYDGKIISWYGPRRHVLLYPLRHDRHPDSVYSLSPVGPPMQEWLLAHDPVAAAQQSPEELAQRLAVPGNPMRRPESRRAFDL